MNQSQNENTVSTHAAAKSCNAFLSALGDLLQVDDEVRADVIAFVTDFCDRRLGKGTRVAVEAAPRLAKGK